MALKYCLDKSGCCIHHSNSFNGFSLIFYEIYQCSSCLGSFPSTAFLHVLDTRYIYKKSAHYSVNICVLKILSYLAQRSLTPKTRLMKNLPMKHGVTKGFHFEFLLFLTHTNDISNIQESNTSIMFQADEIKH